MNMKKIIAGIMAVCVMGVMPSVVNADNAVITASAEDYTEGTYEQLEYKNYGDHIEISICDQSATEVVIPSEIEGLPVTSIGEQAFNACYNLTSVDIPDSVTNIGIQAFIGCSGLTSIKIPDSVTNIGASAFGYCVNLTSIEISDSVTSIGRNAFSDTIWFREKREENPLVIVSGLVIDGRNCSGDVVIPDGVKGICHSAFFRCDDMTSVTIPYSVTKIENNSFTECLGLQSITILNPDCEIHDYEYTITNKITGIKYDFDGTIYGYANSTAQAYAEKYGRKFEALDYTEGTYEQLKYKNHGGHIEISACDKYATEVEIPAEIEGLPVTSIGEFAFEECRMTSIKIPDSIKYIGNAAFYRCSALTSITIPDGVTSIEGGLFEDCSDLTSVSIPDSVTIIKAGAFLNCSALREIEIPRNVASIDDPAFGFCRNLESITILNPDCEISDSEYTISSGRTDNNEYYFDGTIYGYADSTAQAYAEKYGRKFELLDGVPTEELATGDIDGNGNIDATDASFVLAEYAVLSTSSTGTFTEAMNKSADVNGDGMIDAVDASVILGYYAYTSTGGTDTIEKYLETADI